MSRQSLVQWEQTHQSGLGSEILLAQHGLYDLDLFSDEGLLRVFDTHDEDYLLIYTMGSDHTKLDDFELGGRNGLSSQNLLDGVKEGRLWLNILRMQQFHPEFACLINRVYDELEAKTPGFTAHRRSANLLVSSPTAQVYYHADAPENMLWHMRGRKKVWIYPPNDERFITRNELEMIFSGESEEDVAYNPEFDEFARTFELKPGQMITWPQNTPHRVENVSGLNVSLTTEHYSDMALRKRTTYLSNYYLRRWFKLPVFSTRQDGLSASLKRRIYLAGRRAGLPLVKEFEMPETFDLDSDAAHRRKG